MIRSASLTWSSYKLAELPKSANLAYLVPHRVNPLGVEGTGSKTEIGQFDMTSVVYQEVLIISGVRVWVDDVPLALDLDGCILACATRSHP
jgi:hypothetical protein